MQALGMFDLTGKVAVVTGGGGILGGAMAGGLAAAGAKIAIADVRREMAEAAAARIRDAGGVAKAYEMDAFSKESIASCCDAVYREFGQVDVLLNTVGGNMKEATTSPDQPFFDLSVDVLRKVFDLNIVAGAISPCQVFVKRMKDNPNGASIINVSSMCAFRPLTRVLGYSAAKAAVSNFTQWLAVHLAQEYGRSLRVNAIAPGFFLTDQNRYLLTDEKTGGLTDRGKTIIAHTPMGEFGHPDDLIGVAVWLASDASRFVTGIVVPIDGGFSAFSGV